MTRFLAVCVLALGVAGCNTWQGFGRDLEAAGSAISRSADKARK